MTEVQRLLENEHSKSTNLKVVEMVCSNPLHFQEIIRIISQEEEPLPRRAAWTISYIAERDPSIVEPFLSDLIKLLKDRKQHSAIRRNITRTLHFVDITEELEGEFLDECFRLLNSHDEPIAVKVFSMEVIWRLCAKYPEITGELEASIEAQWEYASTGFRSRGRKIINKIQNQTT